MNIFLTSLVLVLAIYGLMQMLTNFLYGNPQHMLSQTATLHKVLFVKDCEDCLEGIVRAIEKTNINEELIIVDQGSVDSTICIMNNLKKQFNFIRIMEMDEYLKYVQKINLSEGN